MTADFGMNAFAIWFAMLTILSETVSAVIQNLINLSSNPEKAKAAMDAVLKVVGTTDNLQKIGSALGSSSGITGDTISTKSKYALTFGVAVAAIVVQAMLVLIFLYLGMMLCVMYTSPASRQKNMTRTLKDWYDQECFWNSSFLHPSLSKAKLIQLVASLLSLTILIFGLAIVPDAGIAFGAVAFPAITTLKTIMGSVPKSSAVVATPRPDDKFTCLQSDILSFPLKDLPHVSFMDMLFTPTSQLLTHGEAIALSDALAKTRSFAPENLG
jgi:hypothetical protein